MAKDSRYAELNLRSVVIILNFLKKKHNALMKNSLKGSCRGSGPGLSLGSWSRDPWIGGRHVTSGISLALREVVSAQRINNHGQSEPSSHPLFKRFSLLWWLPAVNVWQVDTFLTLLPIPEITLLVYINSIYLFKN